MLERIENIFLFLLTKKGRKIIIFAFILFIVFYNLIFNFTMGYNFSYDLNKTLIDLNLKEKTPSIEGDFLVERFKNFEKKHELTTFQKENDLFLNESLNLEFIVSDFNENIIFLKPKNYRIKNDFNNILVSLRVDNISGKFNNVNVGDILYLETENFVFKNFITGLIVIEEANNIVNKTQNITY